MSSQQRCRRRTEPSAGSGVSVSEAVDAEHDDRTRDGIAQCPDQPQDADHLRPFQQMTTAPSRQTQTYPAESRVMAVGMFLPRLTGSASLSLSASAIPFPRGPSAI